MLLLKLIVSIRMIPDCPYMQAAGRAQMPGCALRSSGAWGPTSGGVGLMIKRETSRPSPPPRNKNPNFYVAIQALPVKFLGKHEWVPCL